MSCEKDNTQNVHTSLNLKTCQATNTSHTFSLLPDFSEQSDLYSPSLSVFYLFFNPVCSLPTSVKCLSVTKAVSKSNSFHTLTDPLSFGTILQMFFEVCTFLGSHNTSLISLLPLNVLCLSSLIFVLGLLDSELGSVHAQ